MTTKDTNSIDDHGIDFERIIELTSKYEQIKKSGEIKRYNEESTKKDFILPLFKALGWNIDNRGKTNDFVSAEETISKKRVDYGFRINGIPKFFLEAKSLKEENQLQSIVRQWYSKGKGHLMKEAKKLCIIFYVRGNDNRLKESNRRGKNSTMLHISAGTSIRLLLFPFSSQDVSRGKMSCLTLLHS